MGVVVGGSGCGWVKGGNLKSNVVYTVCGGLT